ncbi:MAG: DMT family transporter [Anaerolineae bacterium]|uniref:DMT family transporter n=1 Tax=Promineifilum sp. TaxID=2664178 RepID=UPI001DFFFCA3|nr:DMT family transporter [Anaerolineales bacterium]MCO5180780.1 DMT family transporter [Promineifilum sp.]MCW5845978.1 DMT family transporter [Anaerolineae bacterium]
MNGKNLLLLIILAALWGPSFLFIKVAVEDIPPLTLVLGRVAVGAAFLLIVLRAQRGGLPSDRRIWRHLAVVALLHNALPWVLLSWGEQYIDSALASILNGTTPLFTIILAHFLVPGDRMTASKLTGVLIGFAGLVLLILPSLGGGLQATTWGLAAVTAAAAIYGVAMIYSRNHLRGLPPLTAPASQLLLATLYMAPIAVLIDKPWTLDRPSPVALGSLLLLGILGTGLAFIVYYRLLETAGPTYISMVTYVIPIFGVVLGVLILNEQLTWYALGGFSLILLGVMVVNGLFANHLPVLRRRSP